MVGVFLASLWLAAAVAGATLLDDPPRAHDVRAADHAGALGSLRFWILCSLGFGLSGMPLTALVEPITALLAASATGALLGRIVWPLFAESSAETTHHVLAGEIGRVVLPVSPARGKILIETPSRRVELPARSGDGTTLGMGRRVFVAFIEEGVATVIGYP